MKLQTIEYMLFCKHNGVQHTGYATIDSLVMDNLATLETKLKKLVNNHIRKYPDEK